MNNRLPDHETEADWVKNMDEVEIVNYDPRWPVLFDEEEAGTYERLKRRLAAEHRTDREAFTDAKSAYVESVMRKPMKSRCLFDDTLVVAIRGKPDLGRKLISLEIDPIQTSL